MTMRTASSKQQLSVVMFPWFAIGHITPYLHLSNRLADRGHRVAFLLPGGATLSKMAALNGHPDLITFHPITVPHVDGLPPGAETTADLPPHLIPRLFEAFDATEGQFRSIVASRLGRVDLVFYDSAMWVPPIGHQLGFVSVGYGVVSAVVSALRFVPSGRLVKGMSDEEMARTPPGYPSTTVVPRPDEIAMSRIFAEKFGSVSLCDRIITSVSSADAMALRTCWELEGKFIEYMEEQYGKRALLTGPILPDRVHGPGRDEKWAGWLSKYPRGSVVYCAFGSEGFLHKDQFQELLRGFELCGRPFLVALKPPEGCETVEEAFPEGFEEGRGMVCGGWVPQSEILDHPSVGCFVSHCGFGSMWESLLSDCQIVLVPRLNDQILGTMLMTKDLKVGVEVEKDEKGWISKEKLSEAIEMVMDEDSEVAKEVRKNHLKLREVLGDEKLQEKYLDEFVDQLRHLL